MSGTNNPFDDDNNNDYYHSTPVDPYANNKKIHRKNQSVPDNPYEFEAQFKNSNNNNQPTSEDRESLIAGMDATTTTTTSTTSFTSSTTTTATTMKRPMTMKSSQRASTVGAEMQKLTASLLGSTSGVMNTMNMNFTTTTTAAAAAAAVAGGFSNNYSSNTMLVTKKQIPVVRWPYDDYHLTQKMFYEKLEEKESKATATNNTNTTGAGGGDSIMEEQNMSSIPIFSRPNDPPEIRHAVVGLPLTDFEAKAEERGISIVSTWLFDAGLIDELLVNGGMSPDVVLTPSTTIHGAAGAGAGGGTDDNNNINSATTAAGSDSLSAEGVEIGALGHVLEGSNKMDKEIAKLRSATKRQLTLINARLNDGVSASGSEVQELVAAVNSTKDDLGRLRELSSYISNAKDLESANNFMIQNYPLLKSAVHARKNLGRCFRELGFFSQIPDICERLREQLYAGEYTAHEWTNLRNVCREHVELEIILVEAEVGMKERLADIGEYKSSDGSRPPPSIRGGGGGGGGKFGKEAYNERGLEMNKAEVDHFLKEHVKNVWELGDEIRIRLLSGIGSAFDLAMNNPAGMVALVEAVEVYETAAEEYKKVHGVEAGQVQNLRFTDMRSSALLSLYKDMEVRGMDVFKDLVMQAADIAEEEEATNQQFTAVLRAASELVGEIGFVKNQMAPCFPPYWAIETIWTTSVAHLCSSQILQQIGGPEGHKLSDLTVNQLLDLVAWVESFREVVQETFPDIGNISTEKTYFDRRPNLLTEGNKGVDVKTAKDSLAWVNNTLWLVHDSAKDEFLYRTKEQTIEWLEKIYATDHSETKTAEGRIFTSLCEDVFSLAGIQLRTIKERLTRKSEALVQAVGVILKNLYDVQNKGRDRFLKDFESCCAASNDFLRMSETCDSVVSEIRNETKLSPEILEQLEEQSAALIGLYSADAVYAGQKAHVYIFEPIQEAISADLFGTDWLDDLTHNQLAWTLVRTLEDFMEDLEHFLDDFMVQKVTEALVSASVVFYIKCLLQKASIHTSKKDSFFSNNRKALDRMSGDISTIKEYFDNQAQTMGSLKRIIDREFEVLTAIQEMISIAAGLSQSDPHDFILVLQKRIRNITITKLIVGDIYHLISPASERSVYDLVDSMEEEMTAIAPTDEKAVASAQERSTVPGLRLDQMMAKHCDLSKRKRPFKATALERTENMLQGWRATWAETSNLHASVVKSSIQASAVQSNIRASVVQSNVHESVTNSTSVEV